MARTDAAAELAANMVEALRQRGGAEVFPLTVGRLLALANPAAPIDLAFKALAKKPFMEQLLVARKKDASAPIALAGDAERLANSPALAEYAVARLATADKPLHPPERVVKQLERGLQPAFATALARAIEQGILPESVGVRVVRGKPLLYHRQFPPPPPPAEALAETILNRLTAQRQTDEYPLPLKRLLELTGATGPLVKKALAAEPFAGAALVAVPGDPTAPVALAGDRDLLAGSAAVLLHVLGKVCTARRPLTGVGPLQARLAEPLRQPFADALARRMAAGDFPEGVGCLPGAAGGDWYLADLLPAPALLATKLLRALADRRRAGAAPAPTTLREFVDEVAPGAAPDVLRAAVADRSFKARIALALPGDLAGPVVLVEDAAQLADAPALLEAALAAARRPDDQAVAPAALVKRVSPALRAAFERRLAADLPATVGRLLIKKKPYLFLLRDAGTSARPDKPPAEAAPPPARPEPRPSAPALTPPDFDRLFEEAFTRLDRERGGHNLVSLVALRRAVPVERATFDAGLAWSRHAGRYTLSAAEGRHGISDEERAAGLLEEGVLLLFVSRRG